MKQRKHNDKKILEKLMETILLSLDELFEIKKPSGFNEGGRYAYLECLEILSEWSRFAEYEILNIEERYPI